MNLISLLLVLWAGLLFRWISKHLLRLTAWTQRLSNDLLGRVGRGPLI